MEHEIIVSAYKGDLYKVKKLFNKNDISPLSIACFHNHIDIVKYIVNEHDVDINEPGYFMQNISWWPPLLCAVYSGNINIVKLLIAKGANSRFLNNLKTSALHIACACEYFDIVKYLCKNTIVDLDSIDINKNTCLMIASMSNYKIAEYLISRNADVNVKNELGKTALHVCTMYNKLNILKLLINSGAIMSYDAQGMTPFIIACFYEHFDLAEYIIDISNVEDKINMYELLGTAYIEINMPMHAISAWARAIELRDENTILPLHELTTVPELLSIYYRDKNNLLVISVNIRTRILTTNNLYTFWLLILSGDVFSKIEHRYKYAIQYYESALEIILYSVYIHVDMLEYIAAKLFKLYYNLNMYEQMLSLLDNILFEILDGGDELCDLYKLMTISMRGCIYLYNKNYKITNIKKILTCYLGIRDIENRTMLHIACKYTYNINFIKMLLGIGYDVYDRTTGGYNMTHIIASKAWPDNIIQPMIKYMIAEKIHLDTFNNDKVTAEQILSNTNIKYTSNVKPLTCLSAHVVINNNINTDELPNELKQFINIHH